MKQEELIREIEHLPPERQREILEIIRGKAKASHHPPEEMVQGSENGQRTLSQSLYGILRFESGPPSDEDVKDMIGEYLLKKYH
jgi:hypothetical protein